MSFAQFLMAATALAAPAPAPQPSAGGPWRGMGPTTQALRDALGARLSIAPEDIIGGTGGQYGRDVAISADGQRLIYLIDVGGIWRTDNAGWSWQPANAGFPNPGGMSVVIDPEDKDWCWVLGTTHMLEQNYNGLFVSKAGGRDWQLVLGSWARDIYWRDALCFGSNETTALGNSRRLFFGARGDINASWNAGKTYPSEPLAYEGVVEAVVDDAGNVTTSYLNYLDNDFGAGDLKTDWFEARSFYCASSDGLHRITWNGSQYAATRLDAGVEGGSGDWKTIATCPLQPSTVWAATAHKVYKSTDRGGSWSEITNNLASIKAGHLELLRLRVSPADANRMGVTTLYPGGPGGGPFSVDSFVTQDGGASWSLVDVDHSNAWLKTERGYSDGALRRCQPFAWHHTDPNICYAMGGPWVTRSENGGLDFEFWSDGTDGIALDEDFWFNPAAPDAVYFGHKDHLNRVTFDYGLTWSVIPSATGHDHSGFGLVVKADPGDYLVIHAENHHYNSQGGTRDITKHLIRSVSTDGGATWAQTELPQSWEDQKSNRGVVFPGGQRIFIGPFMSTDGGQTFGAIPDGVEAVMHVSPSQVTRQGQTNYLLLGFDNNNDTIVESMDSGDTWQVLASAVANVNHIDFDVPSQTLFWTLRTAPHEAYRQRDGGTPEALTSAPSNSYGYAGDHPNSWNCVAVDPTRPGRVYLGAGRDGYQAANVFVYSDNAASEPNEADITWTEISWTTQTSPEGTHPGGTLPTAMHVHPTTGELWVACGAQGTFVYDPALA